MSSNSSCIIFVRLHCHFLQSQSFLLIAWFLECSICLSNYSGLIIHNFFCNGLIIQCLDSVKKSLLKVICPLSFNRNDSPWCLRFKGFIQVSFNGKDYFGRE